MIEKVIYHVWLGPAAPSSREIECRRSVMRLHPDWRFVLVSDGDYEELFRPHEVGNDTTEFMPLEHLWKNASLLALKVNFECFFNRCLEYRGRHNPKAIATDFIRTCLLYAFGGFVLDWDIYALQPFDRFAEDDLVFARIKESLVSEALMAAKPNDERIRELLMNYVETASPESGVCCLNLSSYVEANNLKAYAAEWFIPHKRDSKNIYNHTVNTHSIHLWREQEYDFGDLENIGRRLRGEETVERNEERRFGCYRGGVKVEC